MLKLKAGIDKNYAYSLQSLNKGGGENNSCLLAIHTDYI